MAIKQNKLLTWVEVKKSCIQYNLKQFKKIIGPNIKIMAVVKSSAYGHGMLEVCKTAIKTGIDYLGVINLQEALVLRDNKIKVPIFILSYYNFSSNIIKAIKSNIEFPVYNIEQIKFLSSSAKKVNKKVNIHIKIDTGTSRVGILPSQVKDFIKIINKYPNLQIKGIFTHYADSESKNQSYTDLQTKKLQNIVKDFSIPIIHAGCSASTINNPKTFFDLVRIGIGVYGLWPSEYTKQTSNFNLKPALSWKTRIIQVKKLNKGVFVGYDRTYRTKKTTKIAVLPIGYWDGYDRRLSGKASVLIHGKLCPIRGRICMNLTMVDVTNINNVKIGDEVVLIGKQKNQSITAGDLGKKIKTINYEVVTRINPLIPRIYL